MTRNPIIRYGIFLTLSLAALAFTGCAVNQAQDVATYRNVLDGPNAQPVQNLPVDAPLTLQHAMELANAHNEQLSMKGEDYLQALIDKDRAAASFLPTINLAPSFTATGKSSNTGKPDSSTSTGTQTNVPVNAQMNVFNGFRDVASLQNKNATAEEKKQMLLDLRQTILLDVAQTYYQVLKSEGSVDVLKATLDAQDEHIRQAQAQLATGQGSQLDLAQAQADEATTRVSLVSAQSDVQNGRSTLAFLIGAPQITGPLTDGYQPPVAVPTVENLEASAKLTRQDALAADAAVDAAKHGIDQAVGEYYPSVSIDLQKILDQAPAMGLSWTSAISANIPIFSAGVIQADVRTAYSQLREAEQNQSLVDRQVLQDVQVGNQNFVGSTQRLQELQTELAASQQASDLAEKSYAIGTASNLDRLTALDQLLNARLQLTSEQFNQKVTYLDLLRAMGQLEGVAGSLAKG
jgi:outer membrane protein